MRVEGYEDVIRYYAETTEEYLRYSGDTLNWHIGLWTPGTRNLRTAMTEANRVLVDGCGIGPGTRVLDAGCGVGGLAFYLAQTYGAQVCGVNICEPHVELAQRFARERGLSHLVEFRAMNYMELSFPEGSFDVVVNQDSVGYASDLVAYFAGVRRVLRPGGHYRCLDCFAAGRPFDQEERDLATAIQRGWKAGALRSWQQACAALVEAGFGEVARLDVSELAHPTARGILAMGKEVSARPQDGGLSAHWSDHTSAALAFSTGLLRGAFSYVRVDGARPG